MMGKILKNQIGFTLIELMIVIAVIGILAAIAMPQFTRAQQKARDAQAWAVLEPLAMAAENYYMEHGDYPSSIPELKEAAKKWPQLNDITITCTGFQSEGAKIPYSYIIQYDDNRTGKKYRCGRFTWRTVIEWQVREPGKGEWVNTLDIHQLDK